MLSEFVTQLRNITGAQCTALMMNHPCKQPALARPSRWELHKRDSPAASKLGWSKDASRTGSKQEKKSASQGRSKYPAEQYLAQVEEKTIPPLLIKAGRNKHFLLEKGMTAKEGSMNVWQGFMMESTQPGNPRPPSYGLPLWESRQKVHSGS